jgi:hypothetical protein
MASSDPDLIDDAASYPERHRSVSLGFGYRTLIAEFFFTLCAQSRQLSGLRLSSRHW